MLFIVYLVRCSFAIRYSQVQTLKKMKTIFISRSFFCFRAVKVLSYLLCARALAVNSSSLGAFFVFFSHSLSIFFRFSFCSACTNTHTEFFLIFFSVVSFSFFFFGSLFHAALTLSAHWVFYFNFFFFHIRFLKCVYCVQRFFFIAKRNYRIYGLIGACVFKENICVFKLGRFFVDSECFSVCYRDSVKIYHSHSYLLYQKPKKKTDIFSDLIPFNAFIWMCIKYNLCGIFILISDFCVLSSVSLKTKKITATIMIMRETKTTTWKKWNFNLIKPEINFVKLSLVFSK